MRSPEKPGCGFLRVSGVAPWRASPRRELAPMAGALFQRFDHGDEFADTMEPDGKCGVGYAYAES